MIQNVINSIASNLLRLESRYGLFISSCVTALILLFIAMLYVQPVFKTAYHGIQFSQLSEHPFDFSTPNPLRYRILAPLAGYLLFLRGPLFFLLPLCMTWILPATVYYSYRKKNYGVTDAFLLTCFIIFSCVVLIPLIAAGYTDIVTWFFIFLAFIRTDKTPLSATFFSLALLNHESSIVLLPALLLCSYRLNKKAWPSTILFYLLALVPHLCYRWYVGLHTETLYGISFYLSKGNILFTMKNLVPYFPAAFFYAFKLWWILPAGFTCLAILHKKYLEAAIVLLIVAGACSLVIVGYDYTRMLVIAFPAVLLSYEWLQDYVAPGKLHRFLLVLIVCNFFILQYHFNYDGVQPMFPWLFNKISAMLGMPLV